MSSAVIAAPSRPRFNSLFVGMCFAIHVAHDDILDDIVFQFPFRRDVLCNLELRKVLSAHRYRFNSLFVGMCFAIGLRVPRCRGRADRFQFPFRRDVLCNARISDMVISDHLAFQFPFRRDVLCNQRPGQCHPHRRIVSIPFSSGCALQFPALRGMGRGPSCFNSLFVGMCFAMIEFDCFKTRLDFVSIPFSSGCALQFVTKLRREVKEWSFNSLFVGMCFAIRGEPEERLLPRQSFNSLFVGMCFAIWFGRCAGHHPGCFNSLFVGMCFAIAPQKSPIGLNLTPGWSF